MSLAIAPHAFDQTDARYGAGMRDRIGQAAIAHRAQFGEIWVCDFEFVAGPGCRPDPVCCVAREMFTGREFRLWRDELHHLRRAPWDTGHNSLTVAYFASAEFSCFHALGWQAPCNVIDLFAEFRSETNGLILPLGQSLLGALAWYGLSGMSSGEKQTMRELITSGGPWTASERAQILDYCAEDVDATERLFDAMAPILTTHPKRIGHAILRGRYMAVVAMMESTGIPVDIETFELLKANWINIQDALISTVDQDFGVYDGRTFKADRFAAWLAKYGIPWPRHESGQLALDDDTFRQMARSYPLVSPLRELRHALAGMRLNDIPVGRDGRNRTLLSPFRSRTGRNQPSNSRFLFGTAVWLRGLIKPDEGMALAYLDFSSQEIAIAAALSGDAALWRAYASGDPYMQFAIDAGLAPPGATKASHGDVRARCKAIVLGTLYGMSEYGLATASGMMIVEARQLLIRHRETYRQFWSWAELNVDRALLGGVLTTPFGWQYRLGPGSIASPRSLLNWPMQASGSDMLRLACIGFARAGIRICAPIHDAILIEAPIGHINAAVETARAAMIEASALVMGGPACRVDAEVIAWPNRYMDEERGTVMWNRVMSLVGGPLHAPAGTR